MRWSFGFDQPEAWVRRVAFNLALQRLRKLKRQVRAFARHGSAPAVSELSGDRVDLTRALGRLSPRLRAVLVLHYVVDLPVEQIAGQLRIPIGTVKSRLRRGREALAPLLTTDHTESELMHDAR
jgi:RNA polymerase sigma factor (sigma-70 family)